MSCHAMPMSTIEWGYGLQYKMLMEDFPLKSSLKPFFFSIDRWMMMLTITISYYDCARWEHLVPLQLLLLLDAAKKMKKTPDVEDEFFPLYFHHLAF